VIEPHARRRYERTRRGTICHVATHLADQLDGWWRDRTTWPTLRFFDVSTRWFDCQFHSTLLDLTDEPLIEAEI